MKSSKMLFLSMIAVFSMVSGLNGNRSEKEMMSVESNQWKGLLNNGLRKDEEGNTVLHILAQNCDRSEISSDLEIVLFVFLFDQLTKKHGKKEVLGLFLSSNNEGKTASDIMNEKYKHGNCGQSCRDVDQFVKALESLDKKLKESWFF